MGPLLARLARRYGAGYLETDPVRIVHEYDDPADQEVVALLTACLAYGRVGGIVRSVGRVLDSTGLREKPALRLGSLDPLRATRALTGFRHRFTTGEDVACLLHLLRQAIEDSGSLRVFFVRGLSLEDGDIGPSLVSFAARFHRFDPRPVLGSRTVPRRAGVRFLVPSPADGSACKRMCMFLRWMVRGPDGVDLGLWKEIGPARLVVPLDTHLARISHRLGLASRPAPSWDRALEVTASLKHLDPGDPTRFDFALSRLGIVEGCRARPQPDGCAGCAVRGACEAGGLRSGARGSRPSPRG